MSSFVAGPSQKKHFREHLDKHIIREKRNIQEIMLGVQRHIKVNILSRDMLAKFDIRIHLEKHQNLEEQDIQHIQRGIGSHITANIREGSFPNTLTLNKFGTTTHSEKPRQSINLA